MYYEQTNKHKKNPESVYNERNSKRMKQINTFDNGEEGEKLRYLHVEKADIGKETQRNTRKEKLKEGKFARIVGTAAKGIKT